MDDIRNLYRCFLCMEIMIPIEEEISKNKINNGIIHKENFS